MRSAYGGWWAVDVAAYLLAPLRHLGGLDPARLDSDAISRWIRETELTWSPGLADHRTRPWDRLVARRDAQLVDVVLTFAGAELDGEPDDSPLKLLARRRLPVTTLEAYTRRPLSDPRTEIACADAHVHQGAALPIEVTLHWVASQLSSIAEDGRARHSRERRSIETLRLLADVDGQPFHPLPLLLSLRAIVDGHPEWHRAYALARKAALPGADANLWEQLTALLEYTEAGTDTPSLEHVRRIKADAAAWAEDRRVAMYRIEALFHGAVTQRSPGLDIFVRLFEDLASVRRGLLDKQTYYACAIREHIAQTDNLKALELRLGERVLADGSPTPGEIGNEYLQALRGYRAIVEDRPEGEAVRVTFPMGLVKTRADRRPPVHWRFDPGGIYDLVEALVELLGRCRSLAPFVDGIDVCGEERDVPNWLFRPAYERFYAAMARAGGRMTCRFHAGEWQWTPVHGLRRIAEFLRFELPTGTPRRVGHGLALVSSDWSRMREQPVDELLDDLVWAFDVLDDAQAAPELLRALDRAACDVLAVAFPRLSAEGVGMAELRAAQAAREDVVSLRRIGFLSQRRGRLCFEDRPPAPGRDRPVDHVVVEQLRMRDPPPALGEAAGRMQEAGPTDYLERLRLVLSDAYELLVDEVMRDIRWSSVVIETCPTSNVMVGGVRGYKEHPFASFVERGALVAIGSDDPSLFHAWLGDELGIARDAIGISPRDLLRLQRRAVEDVAPLLDAKALMPALDRAVRQLLDYGVAVA